MGYNKAEMPIIQAGKISTYYQQIGKGPYLVLLHGWANTWEAWASLIPQLSDDYTLLIPDLPSFGKSATPSRTGWNTKDYAEWLGEFLRATVGARPFALVGHSYGGKVGVYYTSHNTSPMPQQLVLIGSSGVINALTPSKKLVSGVTRAIPRFMKDLLPSAVVKLFYEKVVGETDYVHANAFQKSVLHNILAEDFTDAMSNIKIPTLILWGENDTSSPTEKAEIFHRQIKNSTLQIVPGTGHFPHQEKTPVVYAALKEFIDL